MRSLGALIRIVALATFGCGAEPSSIPTYSTCQDDGVPNTESGVTPFAAELLVPNVDLGVQWYRDTAGFRLLFDAAERESCFAELELDGSHILLAHVNRTFVAPEDSIELRFVVSDVDALYTRLIAREVYGFRVRFASALE